MALTRQQSIDKYGTEAYTAWDEPGAQADWSAKNPNPIQTQPHPNQVQGFQPIKGFSETQNKYAQHLSNAPDYGSLYNQYSQETGLADVKKLVLSIDNTVADIEDKIAKIEPNINKEIGNYDITEGQRQRMVVSEQEPLRTQYADILRSRSRLSAEASSKADLVNTLMGFAQQGYNTQADYLKALMDMEQSNKSSVASNPFQYLPKKENVQLPDASTPSYKVGSMVNGKVVQGPQAPNYQQRASEIFGTNTEYPVSGSSATLKVQPTTKIADRIKSFFA